MKQLVNADDAKTCKRALLAYRCLLWDDIFRCIQFLSEGAYIQKIFQDKDYIKKI